MDGWNRISMAPRDGTLVELRISCGRSMSETTDIPADVMERARSVQRELGGFNRYPSTAAIYIAQALLSERQRALEEAAKIEQEWHDKIVKVLRAHHEWHLESGVYGLPDGDGGWIEIDNSAEYSDSRLCERTEEVLGLEPPVFKPTPRLGSASNHWENWMLAIRELRLVRKLLKPFADAADEADAREAEHLALGMGKLSDSASTGLGITFGHCRAARAYLKPIEERRASAIRSAS